MRYKLILFDNDDTLMDFQAGNRNAVGLLLDEQSARQEKRMKRLSWALIAAAVVLAAAMSLSALAAQWIILDPAKLAEEK